MSRTAVVMTLKAEGFQYPYLATPYTQRATHPLTGEFYLDGANDAAADAAAWAGWFAANGVSAECPIVQGHYSTLAGKFHDLDGAPALLEYDLDPLDPAFWAAWCKPRMERADCMIVPPIAGCDASHGITAELAAFITTGRDVFLIQESEAV